MKMKPCANVTKRAGGCKIRRTVCKIDTKVTKRIPMPVIILLRFIC